VGLSLDAIGEVLDGPSSIEGLLALRVEVGRARDRVGRRLTR
jgi:hypothetical protein